MAYILSSGMQEQKKSSLPTYCYCNHRLLRAIQLVNAELPKVLTAIPFSLDWIASLGSQKEELMAFGKAIEDLKIDRKDAEGWQPSKRSTRIELSPDLHIPNSIKRNLFSSEDYGNGLDYLLCYWLRCNMTYVPWIQEGDVAILNLRDEKSPCTYRVWFKIDDELYVILIEGVKTVRERRRKPTGRTTQNSQPSEDAKTTEGRKLDQGGSMSKMLQEMARNPSDGVNSGHSDFQISL